MVLALHGLGLNQDPPFFQFILKIRGEVFSAQREHCVKEPK